MREYILTALVAIAAIGISPALATSYNDKQISFCTTKDTTMFHGPTLIDQQTHQQYRIHGYPHILKAGTCFSLSDTDFGMHMQQNHQYFFFISDSAKHGHPMAKLIEA